jgi:glycine C-acetyltransferase
MLPGTGIAVAMAQRLLELGVLVTAFSYPVVPEGRERIRVQMNAMHSSKDVALATNAFIRAGRELGVIAKLISMMKLCVISALPWTK